MVAEDDFDCDEWKPLTDLSPLKPSSNINRNSIFNKFDPFASKTIIENSQTKQSDSTQSKWRLTKLFGATSPNLKKKKSSENQLNNSNKSLPKSDEDENNFKEPIQNQEISTVNSNYQYHHPFYTKKIFDDELRAYKYEQTEKLQNRQVEMKKILDGLFNRLNYSQENYIKLKDSLTLFNKIPDSNFNISCEIPKTLPNLKEIIEKTIAKIVSLNESCKTFDDQWEKLVPAQKMFNDLQLKQNNIHSELSQIEKLNCEKLSNINNRKNSFHERLNRFNKDFNTKSSDFSAKTEKLEKELKLKLFYIKRETEKLERLKENIFEANKLLEEIN